MRQLWLYNPINLKDDRAEEFERLIQSELKTSRTWMLKESFAGFWQTFFQHENHPENAEERDL